MKTLMVKYQWKSGSKVCQLYFEVICMKKLSDVNRIGKITFDGYLKAVQGESLLLELLGPCLPTDAVRRTVTSDSGLGCYYLFSHV
ncbi:hypothetical protein TcWFU_003594 [Taenia crassiceps]|uniref:Uncharacterized protein n=1 Tax=Taenia crassiceps TaxID=6207 RepID=A0ABR4Q8K8_9CEST